MIKLINETSDLNQPYTAISRITFEIVDDCNRDQLVEALEQFVRASGYYVAEGDVLDFTNENSELDDSKNQSQLPF